MKSFLLTSSPRRQRICFCACDKPLMHGCEPEFLWYEPQEIIKGIGLAVARGYEGFWVPYKICGSCRYMRCKSQYL